MASFCQSAPWIMLPCTQDFDTTLNVVCSHLPNNVSHIPVCAALRAGTVQLLEVQSSHLSLSAYFSCDLFACNTEKIHHSKSHIVQILMYLENSFLISNGSVLCIALDLENSCKWTSSQHLECGGGELGGTGGISGMVFVSSPENWLQGELKQVTHTLFLPHVKMRKTGIHCKMFWDDQMETEKNFCLGVYSWNVSPLGLFLPALWCADSKGFLKERDEGEMLGFPVCGIPVGSGSCWRSYLVVSSHILCCTRLVGREVSPHSSLLTSNAYLIRAKFHWLLQIMTRWMLSRSLQ